MKHGRPINSLLKAVSILQSFSLQEPELSAGEIARKVGLPRTTVYRIISTLNQARLLDWDTKRRKYRIGPELYMIGSLFVETADILGAAESITKLLNELTDEAVSVSILDRGNVILVMKEEARYAFRFARPIGTILPAYTSSMGKALLTELSEPELDNQYPDEKLEPRTRKSIATKSQLKAELEMIRTNSISIDDEGSYDGVVGISWVIRDNSSRAIAAMGISIPVFRINQERREHLAKLVKLACSHVSYRLGYRGDMNPVIDIQEIRSFWQEEGESSLHPKEISA